jgi:hypothetical protein
LVFVVARQAHRLSGDLVVGSELTASLGAGKDVLTVLVKLELGDDTVGGVDAQGNGLAVGLVAGDTLDVNNVLETVHGGDLALAALVGASDDGDLVVLSDGDRADVVLLAELLGEGSAHDNTALVRGSLEVSSTALAAGRSEGRVNLDHFGGCLARTTLACDHMPRLRD